MQNNINKGERNLTLLVIKISLLLDTMMKDVANEKRKATFKNRAPEGSMLKIFATAKNNNENPNNFRVCADGFALKKIIEIKITVKYVRIFL
jgi:hypothetical protein